MTLTYSSALLLIHLGSVISHVDSRPTPNQSDDTPRPDRVSQLFARTYERPKPSARQTEIELPILGVFVLAFFAWYFYRIFQQRKRDPKPTSPPEPSVFPLGRVVWTRAREDPRLPEIVPTASIVPPPTKDSNDVNGGPQHAIAEVRLPPRAYVPAP